MDGGEELQMTEDDNKKEDKAKERKLKLEGVLTAIKIVRMLHMVEYIWL